MRKGQHDKSVAGHPTTSAGEREGTNEDLLRWLASYLGCGGYNADTVDPGVFQAKILHGLADLEGHAMERAAAICDVKYPTRDTLTETDLRRQLAAEIRAAKPDPIKAEEARAAQAPQAVNDQEIEGFLQRLNAGDLNAYLHLIWKRCWWLFDVAAKDNNRVGAQSAINELSHYAERLKQPAKAAEAPVCTKGLRFSTKCRCPKCLIESQNDWNKAANLITAHPHPQREPAAHPAPAAQARPWTVDGFKFPPLLIDLRLRENEVAILGTDGRNHVYVVTPSGKWIPNGDVLEDRAAPQPEQKDAP